MKKTLKLVLLFTGGLFAVVIGTMFGFILVDRNKTYHIYDVRIVEPIEGMSGYIYTDREAEYVSVKNQSVYMNSAENNFYPIAVYAATSTNTKDVIITSSDTSIAKIVYKNGGCFVQFLREGFVTITSEVAGVKDNIIFHIYDQVPSEFTVYDYAYYGEYAELFPNTLVSYADDVEYRYQFFLDNASHTGDNEHVDGDLIRIDRANLDEEIFSNVYIDSATNELVVKCKKPETPKKENIDSVILLQSFYYSSDGEVKLENDYIVKLHIVLYIPEFLQIEVSSTPDFDEKMVFMRPRKAPIASMDEAEIIANPSVLDKYLASEKAENYLKDNEEKPTYDVYFTDRVDKLYVRFRMVYTNGDVVYLKDGVNATFGFDDENLCKIGPTGDYYIMTLDKTNYFQLGVSVFNVTFTINDFVFEDDKRIFNFIYKESVKENCEYFYAFDSETGFYTFTYWDDRARFVNEIYDEFGNIIGFGGWD